MDIHRLRDQIAIAQAHFTNVEIRYTAQGAICAKLALQTSAGTIYILSMSFDGYPHQMPRVVVDLPTIVASPHRYSDGNICYMHPSMWNPGIHDVKFVVARTAKWLNKYEIWKRTGRWPGAELRH